MVTCLYPNVTIAFTAEKIIKAKNDSHEMATWGDNADEQNHPARRRGRFIAPIADLSALIRINLSRA
jgi:hypothetical protein